MSRHAPDRRWQAHPTWPVEGTAEWWADLRARIIEEYLPETERDLSLPFVGAAFLAAVVYVIALILWALL